MTRSVRHGEGTAHIECFQREVHDNYWSALRLGIVASLDEAIPANATFLRLFELTGELERSETPFKAYSIVERIRSEARAIQAVEKIQWIELTRAIQSAREVLKDHVLLRS